MKRLMGIIFALLSVSAFAGPRLEGTYNLHLYFGDTPPFLDVVTVHVSPEGEITGTMHVPNDFDAELEATSFDGSRFCFEILVPKNASRPVDLVFRYEAEIYPGDPSRMIGFATIIASDGKPETELLYVGSFVMFRRKP